MVLLHVSTIHPGGHTMNMKNVIHRIVMLFFVLCVLTPFIASSSLAAAPRLAADTILYNGKIITVDTKFSIVQAVAIRDGKFRAIGNNRKVKSYAGPKTEMVDLKGKTVVPGFIDTHPHMISAGSRATGLSLTGLYSVEAIKKRIAEKAATAAPGEWIVTSAIGDPPDYFHLPDSLAEKRWPTLQDLDAVAPNNPVIIPTPTTWPHPAVLNSHALKALGISKDTPEEEHGIRVVKDEKTQEVNGQVYGLHIYSLSPYWRKLMGLLPRPTFDEMVQGLKEMITNFNKAGVTTVYEAHNTYPVHFALCKDLWSRQELTMRIVFAYEINTAKPLPEIDAWMKDLTHATGKGFGNDMLRTCGVTASIDGALQFGAALMNKPYLNPFGEPTSGIQLVSDDKLKQVALLAAKNNLRMNICFGGDKAADMAVAAYEAVDKDIPIRDRRWILQHIHQPSPEHIRKSKVLGLDVTTYTSCDYSKGAETYVRRLDGDDWKRVVPLREWLDAGIPIAQSTDGAHYQPMFTIWESLKRIDGRTGQSLMTPAKTITREEAVRIYTINGARVLRMEDKIGSIEPGKLADLVILDKDILTCPLDDIKNTGVQMTMISGKVIYRAK